MPIAIVLDMIETQMYRALDDNEIDPTPDRRLTFLTSLMELLAKDEANVMVPAEAKLLTESAIDILITQTKFEMLLSELD